MPWYFYPQTQTPGSVGLAEKGTPSESGYLSSSGTALSFIDSSGSSADLSGGLAQAQVDIEALQGQLQIQGNAKNPAAVGVIASGLTVAEPCTITSVRLAVGTLPTSAADAFSFNVMQVGEGDLFATAQVWAREPNVTGFAKTVDTGANYTSYLTEVTGTGTAALGALDTLANGDWFVAGYSDIFQGVRIDMDGANVNAQAATLVAEYWDGTEWVELTITDGTASGGATLAQDGTVTWAVPADWQSNAVGSLGNKYWVRFSVSAALTAGTAVDNADIIRAQNHFYSFAPDQNADVGASAEFRLHCTEADANAAGLQVQIVGTYT